jgi:hypothetical protein
MPAVSLLQGSRSECNSAHRSARRIGIGAKPAASRPEGPADPSKPGRRQPVAPRIPDVLRILPLGPATSTASTPPTVDHSVPITVEVRRRTRRAAGPVEVAAFDIVMEAVNIVAKYARARRCTVPVSSRFDQISALCPRRVQAEYLRFRGSVPWWRGGGRWSISHGALAPERVEGLRRPGCWSGATPRTIPSGYHPSPTSMKTVASNPSPIG